MITFGPFCLIPSQQLLLKADQPVHIGARAFEIQFAKYVCKVFGSELLILMGHVTDAGRVCTYMNIPIEWEAFLG